ncbi:hypothetical protein GQS40_07955|uniref:Uncharacterized protein n=1 Tax=Leuconostoc lactis TaxID=1246 RepID=A0A6L7A717_LEULA|nr:hypothetical protein [Leuconostoc lactis]
MNNLYSHLLTGTGIITDKVGHWSMIFIWLLVIPCLKHVEFGIGSYFVGLFNIFLQIKSKDFEKRTRVSGSLLLWLKKVI